MSNIEKFSIATLQDVGERNNEDAIYAESNNRVFVGAVADGVGGLNNGELASAYITKSIELWFKEIAKELNKYTLENLEAEMVRLTERIHSELVSISEERGTPFGSTLTFAMVGQKKYTIIQVGDSRAYAFDGKWVDQITVDQTVAEREKETGEKFEDIEESRKKSILTQCMGCGSISVARYIGTVGKNFDLLLCSDGLSNTMHEADINRELKRKCTGKTALKRLAKMARSRGEEDNISAVLIRRRQE